MKTIIVLLLFINTIFAKQIIKDEPLRFYPGQLTFCTNTVSTSHNNLLINTVFLSLDEQYDKYKWKTTKKINENDTLTTYYYPIWIYIKSYTYNLEDIKENQFINFYNYEIYDPSSDSSLTIKEYINSDEIQANDIQTTLVLKYINPYYKTIITPKNNKYITCQDDLINSRIENDEKYLLYPLLRRVNINNQYYDFRLNNTLSITEKYYQKPTNLR